MREFVAVQTDGEGVVQVSIEDIAKLGEVKGNGECDILLKSGHRIVGVIGVVSVAAANPETGALELRPVVESGSVEEPGTLTD